MDLFLKIIKKRRGLYTNICYLFDLKLIADIGQNCEQDMHLIHFLVSIFALPFTNLIAPTGQIDIHAPQEIHFLSSTIFSPFFCK